MVKPRRIRDHLRANLIAYLALFVALGGTGAWAVDKVTSADIAKNAVRSKHVKKSAVKTSDIANRAVTAAKLADGVEGLQGPPGQDATNVFAYVRDEGDLFQAVVQYGSGVTAVSDPVGDSEYTLTFNRSLVNCVVQALPGYGNPAGSANAAEDSTASISMDVGHPSQVDVFFEAGGGTIDSAFLVTAFC